MDTQKCFGFHVSKIVENVKIFSGKKSEQQEKNQTWNFNQLTVHYN